MDQVRLRRLQTDYDAMRHLVRTKPQIEVDGVSGRPPHLYRLSVKVRSLKERGGKLEFDQDHRIEIRLPLGYPRNPPVCRMLTPVFHPNIAPHAICIGDHWSAGEALDALVMRICEMLAYQSYNIKSPLNGEAAQWVETNLDKLPLDATEFLITDPYISDSVEVVTETTCGNCGIATMDDPARCEKGHTLCSDCAVYCDECSKLLCLVCGTTHCENCHPTVSCTNCQITVEVKHTVQCEAGHTLCNNCAVYCDECSQLLCLICGNLICQNCP